MSGAWKSFINWFLAILLAVLCTDTLWGRYYNGNICNAATPSFSPPRWFPELFLNLYLDLSFELCK